MALNKLARTADRLGMAGAVLCALHCVAIPLLIMAAPFLSWLDFGEEVHGYLALFSVLPVAAGLVPAYLAHRRRDALAWGLAGLACINGAVWIAGPWFGETAETVLTVSGAAALFAAHYRNRLCCELCRAPARHRLFFGN